MRNTGPEHWPGFHTPQLSDNGGNVGLKETFGTRDEQRLQNITFAIPEVLDPNAEDGEINRRETHWKQILLSREFGHNRN